MYIYKENFFQRLDLQMYIEIYRYVKHQLKDTSY
jgi:hypothetical protein